MSRDCVRRNAYWKGINVARQLRAEDLVAYNAHLQETKTVASRHVSVPVFSHPESSGCLDRTSTIPESDRHLTIEKGTVSKKYAKIRN